MAKYLDNDKLLWKFGRSEAVTKDSTWNPSGSYINDGPTRTYEVVLDLTKLSTSSALILNDVVTVPKNFRTEEVEVEVQTAATGTGATLTVGLISNADRTTVVDADGFVAALAQTALTPVGVKLRLSAGSTGAGSSIGVTNATNALITAQAGTAVFTAGLVRIRVKGYFV